MGSSRCSRTEMGGVHNAGGLKGPPAITKTLAQVSKLDREEFPDQPRSANKSVPATYENFLHVIEATGIGIRFNVIAKRPEVTIPGLTAGRQNRDAVLLSHLESLIIRNDMSPAKASSYLLALADTNPFDPFADWVNSEKWDRQGRLAEICATIIPEEGYDLAFRDILVTKWLLSIVAATFKAKGFRSRGVLTLQGGQGIGKTTWLSKLVTPQALRDDVVKLGHSWDGGSKDAKLGALRHRIVELGELEASLRKEMAGLKAFITETSDKIRPPYGKVEAEYPRSTIFAASVNDRQFLLDTTGNSRFWTIPVTRIETDHTVDMQQVFAELKIRFDDGEQWWLTDEEEETLATVNRQHRLISAVESKIEEALDLDLIGASGLPRMTASQVLKAIGIEKPTNAQSKEANVALRTLLGEPTRSKGYYWWRVPWRQPDQSGAAYDPESETY